MRAKLPPAVVVVPANTPALQLRGGSPPLPGPWLSPALSPAEVGVLGLYLAMGSFLETQSI